MSLPADVAVNAWTGEVAAAGTVVPDARKWGARRGLPRGQAVLWDDPVDPSDWQHPDNGYGVLLPEPEDPAMSAADRAAALDAPQPVRDLLAARPGTVVLRWRPGELHERFLRVYRRDGSSQDAEIGLSKFGTGPGRLPRYVLIVAGPESIPWSVQYALAPRHCVGRLPLEPEGLGTYLEAMLSGWPVDPPDREAAVVWTVDHGGKDITREMRAVFADPLARELTDPRLPRLHLAGGDGATADALVSAVRTLRPALVVTSSHGLTGPLTDAAAMRAALGVPVDVRHDPLRVDDLTAAMPAGAVWYSQACCSAGGAGASHYEGLLAPGTTAHEVVTAVAGLGPVVAPAARRLLSRPGPVRAVIGHVEPTFDWTLRVAETGQGLAHDLVSALSTQLYSDRPLGHAFADYRAGVGELHSKWAQLRVRLDQGEVEVREALTRLRLTAVDRQSLVLLGDPTVSLAP